MYGIVGAATQAWALAKAMAKRISVLMGFSRPALRVKPVRQTFFGPTGNGGAQAVSLLVAMVFMFMRFFSLSFSFGE
jgi:hypothetical protein